MNHRFTFNQELIRKTISTSSYFLYTLIFSSILILIGSLAKSDVFAQTLKPIEALLILLLSLLTLLTHKTSSAKLARFCCTVSNYLFFITFLACTLASFETLTFVPSDFKLPIVSLISFALGASALYLKQIHEERYLVYSQFFNIANLLVSISTIFGFIFGSHLIQSQSFFGENSISVAVSLLVFSSAFLMQQPQSGWMPVIFADNIGSKQFRSFTLLAFPALLLIAILASFGNSIGLYDFQYTFNIIVVSSFVIFGFALFFTTLSLNRNDIDRERAIYELRQKEFDLMEAQKLAHVGSWSIEIGTSALKFSPEMYRIHDLPENTPVSLEFIEKFFKEEDLHNIRSQIQNCFENDATFEIQHTIKCLNGNEKHVHARGQVRVNKITGIKELHGTLHDITDFSNTLADLIETKKMYTDLYNEAPDMLLSVDPKTGLVLKCNRTLLKNLGYEMQEVVGCHISKLYSEESSKILPTLTDSFIKTGYIDNIELTVLRKDGSPIDVSLSSTLVTGKNGEILKSRSIWRNISNVKIARELEIRKRAAEESSRLKSNFVATMSHEIRTPLNGVIGMSEALMSTKLNSEQYDIVDTIKQSANTLFYLVNDILDFSKIESGKMSLVPGYFSLRTLISEIEKQLRWAAFKKDLNISFSLTGGDGLNFFGDRNRIQQILTNLISNAIKFTENGSIDVYISVISISPNFSKIFFEVQDTGIGISENDLSQLFRPFYQLDSSLSRSSGGTGLGLSISQTLAELMDSKIQVKSELGKGSKFYFDIQLKHQILEDQTLINPSSSILKFEKTPNVLVAEDIDTNQKVLGSILTEFGCLYTFASNGEEAINALKESSFDIVLMDCQMPKLDGIEATKVIRKMEGDMSKIPVIAVTAHAGSEDRMKCLDAGMSDYISKPFTKGILNEVLSKWIKTNQSVTLPSSPLSINVNSLVDERILNDLKSINSINSPDLIMETFSIFERNLPARLTNIRRALETKNDQDAKMAIHSLKSAASAFGGLSIATICNDMTEDLKQKRFNEALSKTEALPSEVQNVKEYIHGWLLAQS